MAWVHVAQHKEKWRAVVWTAMNVGFRKVREIPVFLPTRTSVSWRYFVMGSRRRKLSIFVKYFLSTGKCCWSCWNFSYSKFFRRHGHMTWSFFQANFPYNMRMHVQWTWLFSEPEILASCTCNRVSFPYSFQRLQLLISESFPRYE